MYWLLVLSKRERTDDAYVNGNKVVISAQVPGTVVSVLTDDTQLVHAGEVLVASIRPMREIESGARRERAGADGAPGPPADVRRPAIRCGDRDPQDRACRAPRTDLKKREPLIAAEAIAPEEVRHAREAVELGKAPLEQADAPGERHRTR